MADATKAAQAAKEVVAQGADEVAETATDVAEAVRSVPAVRLKYAVLGAAGGLVVGGAIGYFLAYKRLETKFDKIANDEIDQMREHFHAKEKARDSEDRKGDLAELKKQVAPYAGDNADDDVPAEEIEYEPATPEAIANAAKAQDELRKKEETEENVFEKHGKSPSDGWDQEHEENSRQPGVPYVVHMDEHGTKGYTETSLTYYAGDDVLAGERDNIFEDQDGLVGVGNLDRFGHGANDPDLVYVRNDEMGVDFEIVRVHKSYAEEVTGISHADFPQRRRRARPDDE